MRLLNRYLFFNLLKPMLYLIVAFSLLFIIGDLMDNMSDFFEAGTGFAAILYYYSLWLPSKVSVIIPICLLLATLYSLSTLTRHSEITAMRASGISIYRIVRPYMLMGVLCMLFTAAVNEYVAPKFGYRADQFAETQKLSGDDVYYEKIPYRNPTHNHSWYIQRFDTRTYTMEHIKLSRFRDDGTILEEYTARKARWMDGRWWFEDGTLQAFDEQGNYAGKAEPFATLEMRRLPEIPADFMREIKDQEYKSSLDRWKYIRTYRDVWSAKTRTKYIVDLHHKLAEPFVCIIIVLLGIPVGAHTGRKGAFAGIMLAIGMFFAFYATQFFMEYLAKQMLIVPWTGSWSAVVAFLIIGTVMTHRMR